MMIRASNNGWRDGVITDVVLEEAVLYNGRKAVISDPNESVEKIDLQHFPPDGGSTTLSLKKRVDFSGQIIPGRDDQLMAIVPFIWQDSEIGREMKDAKGGCFTFVFTVEDNKRIYSPSVDVKTDLTSSAGGNLKR